MFREKSLTKFNDEIWFLSDILALITRWFHYPPPPFLLPIKTMCCLMFQQLNFIKQIFLQKLWNEKKTQFFLLNQDLVSK